MAGGSLSESLPLALLITHCSHTIAFKRKARALLAVG
jgi:hypothetical protein